VTLILVLVQHEFAKSYNRHYPWLSHAVWIPRQRTIAYERFIFLSVAWRILRSLVESMQGALARDSVYKLRSNRNSTIANVRSKVVNATLYFSITLGAFCHLATWSIKELQTVLGRLHSA